MREAPQPRDHRRRCWRAARTCAPTTRWRWTRRAACSATRRGITLRRRRRCEALAGRRRAGRSSPSGRSSAARTSTRSSAALKQPVVFDGRNLYDPAYMKSLGFEYRAIGRAGGRERPAGGVLRADAGRPKSAGSRPAGRARPSAAAAAPAVSCPHDRVVAGWRCRLRRGADDARGAPAAAAALRTRGPRRPRGGHGNRPGGLGNPLQWVRSGLHERRRAAAARGRRAPRGRGAPREVLVEPVTSRRERSVELRIAAVA
ncbi:MAG: hypothetical protein MZW92_47510 [Comamonadaceae bacterium]|nr:hypothetical protein [Comamonadaceae bacterium]